MLTRKGVARRLGKSVATVRRLEDAGELNPECDWRGVHRFDEDEVEYLRARFAEEGSIPAAHSGWFDRDRFGAHADEMRPSNRVAERHARPDPVRDTPEVVSLRAQLDEMRERLEAERDRARDQAEVVSLRAQLDEMRERLEVVRSAVSLWLDAGPVPEVFEALSAALPED